MRDDLTKVPDGRKTIALYRVTAFSLVARGLSRGGKTARSFWNSPAAATNKIIRDETASPD
ncbi:hypothetical protein [Mesorhizobium sp. L48C026A00]|uniref:hypothetical protein n=1 Tax=Mesorhizobium sp. L48C026A00 TaxID=1287182 RepID=UPI00041469CA|nr:hypothetical protein [Mesorhizobium sp. L48C026A00]